MVFIPGQTNPLLFVNNFERMHPINEKDKMYEMLQFVKECDKGTHTKDILPK